MKSISDELACPHNSSIPDGLGGYKKPSDCVLLHETPKSISDELGEIRKNLLMAHGIVAYDEDYFKSADLIFDRAILNLIERERVEARIETRYQIYKEAPGVEESDLTKWNGFVNNIWTNWAVKNNASINHKTGKAQLREEE